MSTRHKRHASDLKFCSCRMCRSGMHSKWGGDTVRFARRSQRRHVKIALKTGRWDEIGNRWGVPYTD